MGVELGVALCGVRCRGEQPPFFFRATWPCNPPPVIADSIADTRPRFAMFATRLCRARPVLAAAASGATALALADRVTRPTECLATIPASSVELKYFNVRGVVETARHVMALGGLEGWKETRWDIDFKKFSGPASLPVCCPGFGAAQASGELDANLGRAPVLVIDGKHVISQSKTIERYMARMLGVLGATEVEAAQIDAFCEHLRDVKDKYQAAKKEADKEKAVKTFFGETMPEFMLKVEKACVATSPYGGPAVVGSALSLADVSLYVFLNDFFDDKASALASVAGCPRLMASLAAVEAEPSIAKYRANRPQTGM